MSREMAPKKQKQRVIHVLVDESLHKRIVSAGVAAREKNGLLGRAGLSDVVRWVLAHGLESIEAKR